MVKTPMTRDEACQILNIEDDESQKEPVDHQEVMDRFETLFEKNSVENGGSFYVRSKIFFAKEHLMQDWPAELNVSKFDNEDEAEPEGEEAEGKEEAQEDAKADEAKESKTEDNKDGGKDDDNQHPNRQ